MQQEHTESKTWSKVTASALFHPAVTRPELELGVQVATLTAQAHGCNVSFTWDELPYPPTVNDVAMQAMVSALDACFSLQTHHLPRLYSSMYRSR